MSVSRGVMQGLYDLGDQLERSRAGALKDVPREVRTRIRTEIDSRLRGAGITRGQVREVIDELEHTRVIGRATLERLAQYL